VAAIVEEDYVAPANVAGDLALDCGGGWGVPVVSGYIPHYGLQAYLPSNVENGGAASTEGRTEEIGVLADRVLQGGFASSELPSDFGFTLEDEEGMGEGVVADGVAGLDDFASEVRALFDVASDQEKSCKDVMFGEHFEQA